MQNQQLYAYFAGAIDADGFITISRSTKRPVKRTYYAVKVGFTGTAEPLVQNLLKESFGGSVYTHIPKKSNAKPWHSWQAGEKKAKAALQAILPYLITKRRQAELCLELIDIMDQQWDEIKATQKPPYRVTDEMLKVRQSYWDQVGQLNQPRNRRKYPLKEIA